MIILSWNFRGARSPRFKSILRDYIHMHRPDIMVIVETKTSGPSADFVCWSFASYKSTQVEAIQFKGGIWVFWRTNSVSLVEIGCHQQALHFRLVMGAFLDLFTVVYSLQ